MRARTDRHRNPTAMITALAKQGGLKLGEDYERGDGFGKKRRYHTALFLGDPVTLTTQVIDKMGFFTRTGRPRWSYSLALVRFMWSLLSANQRRRVVGFMYHREGGREMKELFES